jgi:hypothetical protein
LAAILCFTSPFWLDGPIGITVLLALIGIAFLGFSIWCLVWVFRYAKVNIEIDNDGIWYSHQAKQGGLVSWEKIRSVRERAARHIDLLDSHGRSLIRVNEGLEEELALIQQIIKHAPNLYKDISLPLSFTTLTRALEINEDGFILKTLDGIRNYRFDDIEYVDLWQEYKQSYYSGHHVLRVSLFVKEVTKPIEIPRFNNVEVIYLYKLFKKRTGI